MQYIHHPVMTTEKKLINPSRLCYLDAEGSYQVRSTLPVGDRYKIAGSENHRQRAPREVVDSKIARELRVKLANRVFRFGFALAALGASAVFRKPADGEDLCCAERTVTKVHQQSKVGATHHWFIWARQQD